MRFGSDNWAGAHPAVAVNLSKHASDYSTPYGSSSLDHAIQHRLSEIFEHSLSIFYVSTGTAANALALTSVAKPGGIAFAHREAHIIADECGAPEYFSNQLRLKLIDGADGKMDVGTLREEVANVAAMGVHGGRPNAISVTQPTESGTVYSLEELDAIAAVAREYDIPFLMDGARFANALVHLGCSPAEMTWKRGIDILCFGATKNGCFCAETVIFFDKSKAEDFAFTHKRAGQLFSKSSFVSAQLEAYLKDGLWIDLACHANDMASDLADVFRSAGATRLVREPQNNEVFVVVKDDVVKVLEEAGVSFFAGWPPARELVLGEGEQLCRFVTSFATTGEDVRGVGELVE
ncbi:Threonine aldolase [Vermiconidia calcicola]|uniref:Threonine aldolase n=1 Tax=Vermiconidia calcicola TaxID=1690605 RepID=A0ACC3ND25_9PEZI|nr:Threonine aldolase [Vermiconidia calcicola]